MQMNEDINRIMKCLTLSVQENEIKNLESLSWAINKLENFSMTFEMLDQSRIGQTLQSVRHSKKISLDINGRIRNLIKCWRQLLNADCISVIPNQMKNGVNSTFKIPPEINGIRNGLKENSTLDRQNINGFNHDLSNDILSRENHYKYKRKAEDECEILRKKPTVSEEIRNVINEIESNPPSEPNNATVQSQESDKNSEKVYVTENNYDFEKIKDSQIGISNEKEYENQKPIEIDKSTSEPSLHTENVAKNSFEEKKNFQQALPIENCISLIDQVSEKSPVPHKSPDLDRSPENSSKENIEFPETDKITDRGTPCLPGNRKLSEINQFFPPEEVVSSLSSELIQSPTNSAAACPPAHPVSSNDSCPPVHPVSSNDNCQATTSRFGKPKLKSTKELLDDFRSVLEPDTVQKIMSDKIAQEDDDPASYHPEEFRLREMIQRCNFASLDNNNNTNGNDDEDEDQDQVDDDQGNEKELRDSVGGSSVIVIDSESTKSALPKCDQLVQQFQKMLCSQSNQKVATTDPNRGQSGPRVVLQQFVPWRNLKRAIDCSAPGFFIPKRACPFPVSGEPTAKKKMCEPGGTVTESRFDIDGLLHDYEMRAKRMDIITEAIDQRRREQQAANENVRSLEEISLKLTLKLQQQQAGNTTAPGLPRVPVLRIRKSPHKKPGRRRKNRRKKKRIKNTRQPVKVPVVRVRKPRQPRVKPRPPITNYLDDMPPHPPLWDDSKPLMTRVGGHRVSTEPASVKTAIKSIHIPLETASEVNLVSIDSVSDFLTPTCKVPDDISTSVETVPEYILFVESILKDVLENVCQKTIDPIPDTYPSLVIASEDNAFLETVPKDLHVSMEMITENHVKITDTVPDGSPDAVSQNVSLETDICSVSMETSPEKYQKLLDTVLETHKMSLESQSKDFWNIEKASEKVLDTAPDNAEIARNDVVLVETTPGSHLKTTETTSEIFLGGLDTTKNSSHTLETVPEYILSVENLTEDLTLSDKTTRQDCVTLDTVSKINSDSSNSEHEDLLIVLEETPVNNLEIITEVHPKKSPEILPVSMDISPILQSTIPEILPVQTEVHSVSLETESHNLETVEEVTGWRLAYNLVPGHNCTNHSQSGKTLPLTEMYSLLIGARFLHVFPWVDLPSLPHSGFSNESERYVDAALDMPELFS